ncbi:MAG: PspC domain-containing protein [Bacteroidota bacterium]|nr:PspC domain-containing protein [Bacteroidota bacterium]
MKKNISINISSIIFHIEEDGYEVLKNYLDSIKNYFSRFEDSKEIVNDIENRIAEIFLDKTSPSKQVITLEDVLSLVSTMGTVADFAAIEDMEEPIQETGYTKTEKEYVHQEEKTTEQYSAEPKRLYRNTSKKILGGVASGIASQFNIDPLWIRLIFILIFFSSASFGVKSLAGGAIITYIILWIIVPASATIEDNRSIKKLYRNPDNKVLGGVASGMAAYFGTDALVFRLLFVITIFIGGTGFIIYIIFWIITPEARSITDKIQMQGDPVTLSNIENNVKKNFNLVEEKENPLTKLILLPFRLIAVIFNGLIRILEPLFKFLLEAIRIIFGIILIAVGMSLLISLLVITGYAIGIYNGEDYFFTNMPANFLIENIPLHAIILIFVVLFIPALSIILSGFSAIRKENTVNSSVGWSLFVLWIICLILASATLPGWISKFTHGGAFESAERFMIDDKTLFLTLNEVETNNQDALLLDIYGYNDSEIKVVKKFKARGSTKDLATVNAKNIDYRIIKRDSVLQFDSNLRVKENEKFYIQEAFVNLYIPYEKPFIIDRKLKLLLPYSIKHKMKDQEATRYVFNEEGFKCLDCIEDQY